MERRKKIWAIAAAIGCLGFCSTAAGNDIPDFILATALTSDEISAARKALAIKEDAIKTVKADYLPTLTADVTGSWVREGKKTSALVDRFADITNPHTYTLTVDQNLWNGGQTTISEKIALLDFKSEEYKLLEKIQEKLLELIKLNSEIFKFQSILDLKEKNEDVLEYHLKSSKIRFKMGEISETDVFKSEARYASIISERIKAEYDLATAIQKYEAEHKAEFTKNTSIRPLELKLLPIDEVIANNYTLRAAFLNNKSNDLKYAKQRRANLPSLDMTGSAAHSRQTLNRDNQSTKFTAKLSLTMPLYDGGKNRSQISASLFEWKKSQDEYNSSVKNIKTEVNSLNGEYQALLQKIKAIKIEIKAASKALDATKKEVDVGTKAIVDLLDSEKELLDAKIKLLEEKERLTILTYETKILSGQLISSSVVEQFFNSKYQD